MVVLFLFRGVFLFGQIGDRHRLDSFGGRGNHIEALVIDGHGFQGHGGHGGPLSFIAYCAEISFQEPFLGVRRTALESDKRKESADDDQTFISHSSSSQKLKLTHCLQILTFFMGKKQATK